MQIDLMREIEIRLTSVEERSGLRTSLIMEGDANECPVVWRENLFRITIEALNNSLKHAQAHNVTVSLRCDKARAEVQIADDGIGFNLNRMHSGGMGLRNMHERAELLGGTLEIRSTPNEGTRVTVCVEKREVP